jgi:hypothetical protein
MSHIVESHPISSTIFDVSQDTFDELKALLKTHSRSDQIVQEFNAETLDLRGVAVRAFPRTP